MSEQHPKSRWPSQDRLTPRKRLAAAVLTTVFSRLLLNTARRLAYPFAPALSRGLSVPLTAVTSIIAANQATGVLGIFFGPLADRWGYRRMMLTGLGLLVAGMSAVAVLPSYGTLLAALFMAGLGKTLFDPAIQAWIGERVPFERRATVIGLTEFSWAGSTLVGIPAVGLLMEAFDWRAPFLLIGLLGVVAMAASLVAIARDTVNPRAPGSAAGVIKAWRRLVRERRVVGAVAFGFLVSVANDNLFVVYGAWFEKSFGLSLVALGLSTAVIGAAELLGEALTVALSDRLGVRRAVNLGLIASAAGYLLLPIVGRGLGASLTGLFFIFLLFEFTIVSFISLGTELVSDSRAATMSFVFAAAGCGRVVGALMGGPIWLAGGILATGATSAAVTLLAFASLTWGLRDWQPRSQGA